MGNYRTYFEYTPAPKTAWDKLSIKEMADVMGVAVRNGIYHLDDVKRAYNEFAEGGGISDEEYVGKMEQVAEENYRQWGFENPDQALLHALNDNTYNYRGYYNDNPQSSANANTHWPDTYKTVWHPTFSNESKYSGQKSPYNPLGLHGGHWSDDTEDARFIPQAWQLLQNRYGKGGTLLTPELEQTIANMYAPGGEIAYGQPYYDYTRSGHPLTVNASFPEVAIIPDSQKFPAQRNEDERFRQKYLRDYAEQQSRDYTARQAIAAQRAWENSPEKKAIDFGISAAEGVGMASDVTSSLFGGLPIYSGLKASKALDRATQSGNIADYAEGALWLTPMLTIAGRKVYDAAKPIVQEVFRPGTPAAEWAEKGLYGTLGNENREDQFKGGLFDYFNRLNREETEKYAELGRQDLLDEISREGYKKRWKKAYPKLSDDMIDKIISRQQSIIKEAPYNLSMTSEELSNHPNFDTWGTTEPNPTITSVLDGGRTHYYANTGDNVFIASNRGMFARGTGYHEMQHHMTGMAKGTNWFSERGMISPDVSGLFDPITFQNEETLFTPRGELWQHLILDQNNKLLPKPDRLYDMAVNHPNQLKNELIAVGRTPERAEQIVQQWKEEAQDMMDIQEQRAHLKTFFKDKIKPLLKNPDDAEEIEQVLLEHPELIDETPKVKLLIEELRPGSMKEYAEYFAGSLGVLPFINRSNETGK